MHAAPTQIPRHARCAVSQNARQEDMGDGTCGWWGACGRDTNRPMPAAPIPHLPPISVAMTGLDPAAMGSGAASPGGERARAIIGSLAKAGARAVQIDGTM